MQNMLAQTAASRGVTQRAMEQANWSTADIHYYETVDTAHALRVADMAGVLQPAPTYPIGSPQNPLQTSSGKLPDLEDLKALKKSGDAARALAMAREAMLR